MATPFTSVYDAFYPQIKDYTLYELAEENENAFYEELFGLLKNAIANFPPTHLDLYDYDESMQEFNVDLTQAEITILAKLMVSEYMSPLILDETLTKESLNSKDYRVYSQGKHMDSLRNVKESVQEDVNRTLSRQSYSLENIEKLFGKKNIQRNDRVVGREYERF